ncbi:MAG TPA: hypothetical protein VIH93_00675 [Thermoanaerobaculia bacterium]
MSETLRSLEERLSAVESQQTSAPCTVHITSFAPEPYAIKKPIPITISPEADEFKATFFDAGISASGDTQSEAFSNVRELILDLFDGLSELPALQLGPEPQRQLAVLRDFVSDAQDHAGARGSDRQEAQGAREALSR